MKEKVVCEKVIDEILEFIKLNLIYLYLFDDEALIYLRKYCNDNILKKDKELSYNDLVFFTEEVTAELINCDSLYDFRGII